MTDVPTGVIPPDPPPDRNVGWGLVVGLLMLLVAGAGVAAGYVVAANTRSESTVTTTLQIPTNAPNGRVPALVGLDEDQAVVQLANAGFKSNDSFRPSAKPTGKVISQDPKAGSKAAKGATILIVVDRGAPKSASVVVPSVEGQRVSDAQTRLRAAGLDSTVYVIVGSDPRGVVSSQAPKAGSKAKRGSPVRLNVSAGPPPTTTTAATTTAPATTTGQTTTNSTSIVPDVVGLTRSQASQKFIAAGLVAGFVTVPSSESAGTVVAQAKPPGTMLPRGSTVQVNISNGQG